MDLIRLNLSSVKEAVKKEHQDFLAEYLEETLLVSHRPDQALIQVKVLQKILELTAARIIEKVIAMPEIPGDYGAQVKVKRLPEKWDYEICNDPILTDMEKEATKIKAEIKNRQKFLQNIGGETFDKDSGELIKTTTAKIEYLGKELTINRAALLSSGQTVEVRLP